MNRILFLLSLTVFAACTGNVMKSRNMAPEEQVVLNTNLSGSGPGISVELKKGSSFYYPLFAVWLEDEAGNYIQTLYVAKSVATGIYRFGRQEKYKWTEAEKRSPQTLPYWAHKRGVLASDGLFMPEPGNPVPDAYTGATPVTGFILNSKADRALPSVFKVMLEINQNWDWNEYWTNDKYPDDENYKMSCQPALVYETIIDQRSLNEKYLMKPVGHSHYSGKTGELFTDLSTLTTAMQIADSILVRIK